jgi:hypothetical protein
VAADTVVGGASVAAAVATGAAVGSVVAINPGAGYWSIEPLVALTYLSDDGYEASAKLMYNIKSENDDTDYESGDEFHMDYTLAKHSGN